MKRINVVSTSGGKDSTATWADNGRQVFHWLLADAKPLPFLPCKGRLGFFQVDYPFEVGA